jgi:hypothetical protein
MALLDILNVVLKVGSLSGLAAFLWQILKAWEEDRGRLQVVATRGNWDTLNLRVLYRPKSAHQAIHVHARVIRPTGGRLSALEHPSSHEPLSRTISRTAKKLAAEATAELRLLPAKQDVPGTFAGELVLSHLPVPDGPATVQLSLWADGRRLSLARRRFVVSASD